MGKSRHSKTRDTFSEIEDHHDSHTFIQRSKQKKLVKALKTKDLELLLDEEDDSDPLTTNKWIGNDEQ